MRRLMLFGVLFLTGCSTAPVTGLMDCFAPSKASSDPDYPPRPVERSRGKDPLPDRLPAPELPRSSESRPVHEAADERILPP